MDEIKEKIVKSLTDEVDAIFLETQAKLHVVSGDITPLDSVALETKIAELADIIVRVLEYEKKLTITTICKDGKEYDAQQLANNMETFDLLRQLQEKIEEYHDGK